MNWIAHLEFEPLRQPWLAPVVIFLAFAAWCVAAYGTKYQPWRIRIPVLLLRMLLLAYAAFLLFQPTLTRQHVKPNERKIAVLLDRSGSMGTASGDGSTRYEKAYQVLENLQSQKLGFDVFEFDESLGENLGEQIRPQRLSGGKTDFHASLSAFFSSHADYSSLLVLSDGHDLGRFSQMSNEEARAWLESYKAPPINALLIGDQLSGPEVAIHSIDVPAFSFVRAPLRINATVIVRNLDHFESQVQLLEGDKPVQYKELKLDSQGFGNVEFEIYPDEVGEHLYTLAVPPHHLEHNIENNRQQVLVEVGRDKISVLHISGSISWDLQGLRALFERNPLVDLTAFYIMRTREHMLQDIDNRGIMPDEMALVPFPTEEIFDRQLFGFDLVVFQDFDAGNYFTDSFQERRLLDRIREFVHEHRGGLVIIGGPRMAGGPSIVQSPLASTLPLLPPNSRQPYSELDYASKRTELGKSQPILRRFGELDQVFHGAMRDLKPNKAANVLLTDSKGQPLLATMEAGTGRAVFLASSGSWQWQRDALAQDKPADAYYDFWEQLIKWSTHDPSLNQVRLSGTRSYTNPLQVDLELDLRDRDYKAAANRPGALKIVALDGRDNPQPRSFTTDNSGHAQIKYLADRPGFYRFELADAPWNALSRPLTLFLGGSQEELRNLDLVPETLQRLTSLSGGQFQSRVLKFDPSELKFVKRESRTILETSRLKLRDWVWSLPILLLIAAAEWMVRRSHQLA